MKFYKGNQSNIFYYDKAKNNKLICVYSDNIAVDFCENVQNHNNKNAAYINYSGFKALWLNGKCYGTNNDFTKQSWRRFVKLKAFL